MAGDDHKGIRRDSVKDGGRPASGLLTMPNGVRLQTWFLGIIAFGIILFLLVQAQFILISLVIAIILFSLTSDAINSIARLGIGRLRVPMVLASVVALVLVTAGLLTLTAVVLAQANTVVLTVLEYAEPAQRAVADLFAWMGADVEAAVGAQLLAAACEQARDATLLT